MSSLLDEVPFDLWHQKPTAWCCIISIQESKLLITFSSCSQYYTRFKSYCCEAYNILRKSSNLILNLFHLMAGSNIPDIASDPEKGILKVSFFMFLFWFSVWWVFVCVSCFNQDSIDAIQLQEKFRLDLDDEASIHFFQDLINESVSALFPQMVETIHRWAQYWRWSQKEIGFHKHLCK